MAVQNTPQMRSGSGESHAKAILLGEHSVVYGKPAIAFPVHSLRFTAHATLGGDTWSVETPFYRGHVRPDAEPTDELERLLSITALRNTLEFLGEKPAGMKVQVTGFIPPARGLGSSAAVAAAIARAVAALFEHTLSGSELFELVQSVERVAHGTPSGLDAYATTLNTPIWFESGTAQELRTRTQPRLLIADTGVTGRTSDAVRLVRENLESNTTAVTDLLDELATLVEGAGNDLDAGDFNALGMKMNRNHDILRELGVSAESLDSLVKVALDSGALGAKLTGGGMGGCMIALVEHASDEHIVEQALRSAGASDVWRVYDEREVR